MSEIKRGDLVMVVKPTPCCGSTVNINKILTVLSLTHPPGKSGQIRQTCCGETRKWGSDALLSNNLVYALSRLKKIDPPATGETREAYVNLPEKVTV